MSTSAKFGEESAIPSKLHCHEEQTHKEGTSETERQTLPTICFLTKKLLLDIWCHLIFYSATIYHGDEGGVVVAFNAFSLTQGSP